MNQIGQAPLLQPNLIQSTPQQSVPKPVQPQAQKAQNSSSPAQSENRNFQKLAEDVLAKRASGEAVQRPAVERGQVLDLLV